MKQKRFTSPRFTSPRCMSTFPRRSEGGYLLLIALFVLVLTMTLGSVIAGALLLRMERLERQHTNTQLTALLDGAMARSLAELHDRPGWPGTHGEVPLGDGAYAVDAEWLGQSQVEVRLSASYGQYGRGARAVVDTYLKRVVAWRPLPFDPTSEDGIHRDGIHRDGIHRAD